MDLIRDPFQFQKRCEKERLGGRRVGLVPTMGALHDGHLSLVDEAHKYADFVTASVFVNPTQFGPDEDFDKYPRDLDGDMKLLEERGVSAVFSPNVEMMYPDGHKTTVAVSKITSGLCGAFRTTHFDGVTTIVAKLFNLAGSCAAVFGRKDYQQLKVIERMTSDLLLPVTVIGVHTVREPDGLAMSSRNRYLSDEERDRASMIPVALRAARIAWKNGARDVSDLNRTLNDMVGSEADSVDYAGLYHSEDLYSLDSTEETPDVALAAVAVHIGCARLIDNTVLGEEDPGLDRD